MNGSHYVFLGMFDIFLNAIGAQIISGFIFNKNKENIYSNHQLV